MAKSKVKIPSEMEVNAALERAQKYVDSPGVTSVQYRSGRGLDLFILRMSNGQRVLLPREQLQGLQSATREQASEVEILGRGTGLHWPALDVDLYVPALLRGVYGNRKWMAQIRRNGSTTTSVKKRQASRVTDQKGGRPKFKKFANAVASGPSVFA